MPLDKARIVKPGKTKNETIYVMFNPPSMKITSTNKYADQKTPGGSQEKQQFIKKNNDILAIDFFFDTTREGKDVSAKVEPILELAKVPKNAKEPPRLEFAWGNFSFPCIITSIEHTYDYFNSSGHALRATLSVKFLRCEPEESLDGEPAAKKAASKAAKTEVVKAGQDITCFCSNSSEWRKVAEQNNIDNPLLFDLGEMVGQSILVN